MALTNCPDCNADLTKRAAIQIFYVRQARMVDGFARYSGPLERAEENVTCAACGTDLDDLGVEEDK